MKLSKVMSVFLTVCLLMALLPMNVSASGEYDGRTVVIYTGNIRGNVDVLPLIASVKADFESRGADVILVDTGNFLQGTRYSTFNSGSTMITLMIATGYDVTALGTYDFAFGTGTLGTAFHGDAVDFGPLGELLEMNPAISAVSANISGANEFFHSFTANTTIITDSGVRVGFFGLTDTATADLVLEYNLIGMHFTCPTDATAAQLAALTDLDLVIGLSNAPNHLSHYSGVIMIENEPVAIPGAVTVGAVIIDNETLEYTVRSINLTNFEPDAVVEAAVNEFKAVVDGASVLIGTSDVTLDGSMAANRGGETNLGNFWADALRWFAVSGEINAFFDEDDVAIGNNRIQVETSNIVALWNGGNLRDFLYPGDVTIQDLRRVLPFPNTVAVIYLTGAELLEQLEASTQGLPFTPETYALAAAFMHVSGIEYTINTNRPFNPGEPFRDRIWYTAASIERVSIAAVNGTPFDPSAIYAVITSNANFNGMDISYILAARESDTEHLSTITTARVTDDAVAGFIASLPNSTIDAGRAPLQGRITVPDTPITIGAPIMETPIQNPNEIITRGMFVNMMYVMTGSPEAAFVDRFTDVAPGHPHAHAISWAFRQGLASGVSGTRFATDRNITRQEMAVIVYRFSGSPTVSGSLPFADTEDIESWARDAVIYAVTNDILLGVTSTTFDPHGTVNRALAEAVLAHLDR